MKGVLCTPLFRIIIMNEIQSLVETAIFQKQIPTIHGISVYVYKKTGKKQNYGAISRVIEQVATRYRR